MNERCFEDLVISLLPGLRLTERIVLLQVFDSVDKLFVQSKRDIELILNRELQYFWDITEIIEKAGRIDTICKMKSIKWVSWTDDEYPPLLRECYDPPAVIFYRGILPNPEKSLLGMVGTRKPSPQAAEQAYKIAGNLSRLGVSVVSGLALGIDAMAHRGNLVSGSPAYAVLGSGIDEIYPASNKPLAKRILDSGGAIISEYPPGFPPAKWTFPARNRIIAALSRSVLIVEAPHKSGALITASFALEQGKDLWVASAGVEEGSYDRLGTIKLANDGAEVIHSACDVLEKWNVDASCEHSHEGLTSTGELISSMADFLKIDI
ncbi:MAG: DNA-processing protein DprA [Treponema sp.]|nr:DNA-processing protein DprA [Treponema sp.]